MNTLYKPNGKKVEVNDQSLDYALNTLNWTKKKPAAKKTKKAD